ncbi:MAG: hypothetical protein EOP82_02410 [Variovorax sp.]|nr:MAG: hypothetical protein EOP82_02410 [Variovorax sp.]
MINTAPDEGPKRHQHYTELPKAEVTEKRGRVFSAFQNFGKKRTPSPEDTKLMLQQEYIHIPTPPGDDDEIVSLSELTRPKVQGQTVSEEDASEISYQLGEDKSESEPKV